MPVQKKKLVCAFLTVVGIESARDLGEIERFAHVPTVDIEDVQARRLEVRRGVVRAADEELHERKRDLTEETMGDGAVSYSALCSVLDGLVEVAHADELLIDGLEQRQTGFDFVLRIVRFHGRAHQRHVPIFRCHHVCLTHATHVDI